MIRKDAQEALLLAFLARDRHNSLVQLLNTSVRKFLEDKHEFPEMLVTTIPLGDGSAGADTETFGPFG